jgi:hypothetical protein
LKSFTIPQGIGSLQEETAMLSIPTGDPDSGSQRTQSTQNDKKKQRLSMGEPAYWPSERNKLPDLVDFCVTKRVPQDSAVAKSCFDLSSDHLPVLIALTAHALNQQKQPSSSNRHTNWDDIRHLINERLALNVSLKTEEDIKATVKFFYDTI